MTTLRIEYPHKFGELFECQARNRMARGGRGSAKSWGFAGKALERAVTGKTRILCTRELQNSIKDSVHKLLCDQIDRLGLNAHFEYGESYIRGKNGSEFLFKGLKHNAQEIKSMEGIDICWIEEGQATSQASLDLLLPTIRKEGSEVWVSYNPKNETDPIHQMAENPPPNTIVVDMNWRDNPWWSDELEQQRIHTKETRPDYYDWIWEGKTLSLIEGTYYGALMKAAEDDGRITNVPYDPSCEVYTIWDLGIGDSTAIWFVQYVGQEVHVIDYYEASGVGLDHYAKVLREKPYVYATELVWPHDGKAKELGSGKSRQQTMENLGFQVRILKRAAIDDGIQAVRNLLPRCWFDAEKCKDGINALKAYSKQYDEDKKVYKDRPLHDWSSHGADAFRYVAMSGGASQEINLDFSNQGSGWMGA